MNRKYALYLIIFIRKPNEFPSNLIINKSNSLIGTIEIPGDKSISHRSIILGSLTKGNLTITNFLKSDDCLATVEAMKSLGSDIEINNDKVHIKGKGYLV